MAELEILSYQTSWADRWDAFVRKSANGTVFHQRRFLNYHPNDRFVDASLLALADGEIASVLPATWTERAGIGKTLVSHTGASYGGPVFARSATTNTIMTALEAFEAHAKGRDAKAFDMRLAPRVFTWPQDDALTFCLLFRKFEIFRAELSCAVDVAGLPDDILEGMQPACRRNIKKAQRTRLIAGLCEDFTQYWEVLRGNLASHHNVTPTHSLDEIQQLRTLLGNDVQLITANLGDEIAAGACVFRCNDNAAHTFYLASRDQYRDLRPLNLALYEVIAWARREKIRFVNFGVSTPGGESINWGLLRFKEGFGAQRVSRLSYRKHL